VGVGGDDVDLGTGGLELGVVVGASSISVGQLKVKAAGMKTKADQRPLIVWSETSTNLPLWNACALNGWTWVLIRDISASFRWGFDPGDKPLPACRWKECIE
jgi:hypothetical protein